MKQYFKEKCGLIGLFHTHRAAQKIAIGLHHLQHRGEDSCGLVVKCENDILSEFHHDKVLNSMLIQPSLQKKSFYGIGHVRYSTVNNDKFSLYPLIQPFFHQISSSCFFTLAHNGHIKCNIKKMPHIINIQKKHYLSDSMIFFHIVMHFYKDKKDMNIAIQKSLKYISGGGYAILIMNDRGIWAIRDSYGIRPLFIGHNKYYQWAISSEEGSLYKTKYYHNIRELDPGECIHVYNNCITTITKNKKISKPRLCLLEIIYFSRNDSSAYGTSIYDIRKKIGKTLATKYTLPHNAECICPIPDGALPLSIGFAQKCGIAMEIGLQKMPQIGRSFIQKNNEMRYHIAENKFFINKNVFHNKHVILVDDSLVRGTTLKTIVKQIKSVCTPKSIHCVIGCPPILYPDIYGIDLPSQNELIAFEKNIDEICIEINIDSLFFLSLNDLYKAILNEKRNNEFPQIADHVFTGNYL